MIRNSVDVGLAETTAVNFLDPDFWFLGALLEVALHGRALNMRDIKNARVLWIKGALFLALGIASGLLLLVEAPTIRVAFLWSLSVWAFCRASYFAFYVIEHYVDPTYRLSGLLSVVGHVLRKTRS